VAITAAALAAADVAAGRPPAWIWLVGTALALAAVLAWEVEAVGAMARAEEEADRRTADTARFRREIVTTVSHELRTPLTVIQGLVSLLNRRWDTLPQGEVAELFDAISLNVASLDSSILHFVDAGRLERGDYGVEPGWVPLKELVDGVLAKLAGVLAGHHVEVRVDAEQAWADPEALARILELLLSNAARFAPLGTPVLVRASRGPQGLEMAVVDKGPGIPPRDLPHVFEPFWRAAVSDTGVSRGAGLGLSIVKALAERHGGTVRVLSSRDRGSAFHVSLPGPLSAEVPAPLPDPSPLPAAAGPWTGSPVAHGSTSAAVSGAR